MHYLFTDTDPSEVIEIYGDEARHAKVLRLKADESVGLLNGKGRILITNTWVKIKSPWVWLIRSKYRHRYRVYI